MRKVFVLAAVLLGLVPSAAVAEVKPPAGLVEFSPERGSLEASLQASLQAAQQDLQAVCPQERFAGVPDKQLARVLLHCAAVEEAGSEEARMARAQSNAECTGSCMSQGAQVLKRSGFDDVAIGLVRVDGRQLTVVGVAGPQGRTLWTNQHGGVIGERVVEKLEWEVLVTPRKAYRRPS